MDVDGFPLPNITKVKKDKRSVLNGYVFSGGKTHRDYSLFIRVAKDAQIKAIIICGEKYFKTLKDEGRGKVEIYSSVNYETFWSMVKEAKYVVVPVAEQNISCGQLVFLGAMSLGKAVVVPKVSATADYLKDGITGFFYEYGEYSSLLNVIERLENAPELVERVGRQAKKDVIRNYNVKDFVKRLEELMFIVLHEHYQA